MTPASTSPRINLPKGSPTVVPPRVSILVVDDNPSKRLALASVLVPLDYHIVEADSGLAALRCVMAEDFAVILLDVRMPGMDGFETAGLIRQRRESEMTPIIFITAYSSDEFVADRYVEGAVDFMFAPVEPDELRAKVSVFANLFLKAEKLATLARGVQASADQLTLLTDAAPIGIFQTDANNRYIYTNPHWTEVSGASAEDAAGQEWTFFLDNDQQELLKAELADGSINPDNLIRRFETGTTPAGTRIVLVTSKSIPGVDGGIAGWVGTLSDVTAEAGAEAALADARDEATEASQLKSDFLANMSHEIRTPMNGIMGMAEMLLETDLNEDQRNYAETVRTSGDALLTIINDILDLSKIEAGMLQIEDIAFDLRTTVTGVLDLLAGSAQANALGMVANIDSSIPATLIGDPGRLRQILINLVGNAIKFTQEGDITVGVTQDDPGAHTIRFEVSDTGSGIAPEKLGTIFQPFVQAELSTSREYGGTGLGLGISAQLVALMGGECGVTSRLGAGSIFWFTVRLQAGPGQEEDIQSPPDGQLQQEDTHLQASAHA